MNIKKNNHLMISPSIENGSRGDKKWILSYYPNYSNLSKVNAPILSIFPPYILLLHRFSISFLGVHLTMKSYVLNSIQTNNPWLKNDRKIISPSIKYESRKQKKRILNYHPSSLNLTEVKVPIPSTPFIFVSPHPFNNSL